MPLQAAVSAYELVVLGVHVVLGRGCQEKCRNALYIARCGGLLGVWRAVVWHPLLLQRTGYAFIRYQASRSRIAVSLAGLAATLALTVLANHGHRQKTPKQRRFADRFPEADQPAATLLIARM